jgi:hypothetical protein
MISGRGSKVGRACAKEANGAGIPMRPRRRAELTLKEAIAGKRRSNLVSWTRLADVAPPGEEELQR